jgi:DNA-binding NarL/FixJ family response regulator
MEIAYKLNISVPTVNTYIRRTYDKLHVCCREEAVARFVHPSHPEVKPTGAVPK